MRRRDRRGALRHFVSTRHELAVLDMGRHVGRARRRAGQLREHDEAADHQHERGDQRARRCAASGQRPGSQHARPRRPQKDGVDDERRQEQRELGEDGADHGRIIARHSPARGSAAKPAGWVPLPPDKSVRTNSAEFPRSRPRCSARRTAWRSTCAARPSSRGCAGAWLLRVHQEGERHLEGVGDLALVEREPIVGADARDRRQDAEAGEGEIEVEIADRLDQIVRSSPISSSASRSAAAGRRGVVRIDLAARERRSGRDGSAARCAA